MTIGLAIGFLFSGLIALWIGGEGIVRSVMSYAKMFSVGVFMLSLTLLAAATSGPELFFNISASLQGEASLGLGNILGSNIVNIGLIFAIATLLIPSVKKDKDAIWAFPALLGISLYFTYLGLDGYISRIEGVTLIVIFIVWMFFTVRGERKKYLIEKLGQVIPEHKERKHIVSTSLLFGASVVMLLGGAELLVRGVSEMASIWNVSPFLLSALIVALGTSLPEFATIVVSLYKKRSDIGSGTIFGSNIFNLSFIVGVTALIEPITFSRTTFIFLAFLVIVTTMLSAPIIFQFKYQSRLWSGLLLATYVIFLLYITSQIKV